MKAIDSLLNILLQQDGTELRLASDQRPQMFKGDVELPLTIPAMSAERIRHLLDDLWTAHQAALRERGRVACPMTAPSSARSPCASCSPTERHWKSPSGAAQAAHEPEASAPRTPVDQPPAVPSDLATSPALPAALAALLTRAAARGASDLHLSPRRAPVVRINGRLEALRGRARIRRRRVLAGERGGDSCAAAVRWIAPSTFRASGACASTSTRAKKDCAPPYASCGARRPTLAELNLPPQLEPLVELPHGLVVACGPTGSGKSSTLAALIQHALRARPQVLVTLEDPIEYLIRAKQRAGLVRQREVGTHVRDFATGLRDALREDPDMLLIGEMRDPETISLALTAAETGHLVFASLHSRTAPRPSSASSTPIRPSASGRSASSSPTPCAP